MLSHVCPPPGRRCIVVDDLRLQYFIGVHDYERKARQEVSITIHMIVPDEGPTRTDNISDHVSYADVVGKLREHAISSRHTNLVETLAEDVADFALADPRVESVIVAVRKTHIIPEAKAVGVIIQRHRKSAPTSG